MLFEQFDFIIALCAAEHVLANTVALSNMLQGKSINLLHALKEARVVINVITEERNDPMVWDAPYERTEGMAAECGIEPSMLQRAVPQQHRVNVPADTSVVFLCQIIVDYFGSKTVSLLANTPPFAHTTNN